MNNTIVSITDLNKQKKEVNPNTNHLKLYRGEKIYIKILQDLWDTPKRINKHLMKPQKEKKKKGKERLCKEIMAKKISKSVVGNQHSVS